MSASLAGVMFWLSVASCVVAELAIIRATLRLSRASVTDAALGLPHPRRWLEIVWLVLPALALAALLLGTWRSIDAPPVAGYVIPAAIDAPRPQP